MVVSKNKKQKCSCKVNLNDRFVLFIIMHIMHIKLFRMPIIQIKVIRKYIYVSYYIYYCFVLNSLFFVKQFSVYITSYIRICVSSSTRLKVTQLC